VKSTRASIQLKISHRMRIALEHYALVAELESIEIAALTMIRAQLLAEGIIRDNSKGVFRDPVTDADIEFVGFAPD